MTSSIPEPTTGSKSEPISKTNKTSSIKQQQQNSAAVDREIISLLTQHGFSSTDAQRLTQVFPETDIRQQIEWLPKRNPGKNPTGLLRKAIEENWNEPTAQIPNTVDLENARTFVAHFYAGLAGWDGDPFMAPSDKEVLLAQSFVEQLLKSRPDEQKLPQWGREFGRHVAGETRDKKGIDPTLTYALKASKHGMQFYKQLMSELAQDKKKENENRKEAHLHKYWKRYAAFLKSEYERLSVDDPTAIERFQIARNEKKAEIEGWTHLSADLRDQFLRDHDSPKSKTSEFAKFFGYSFWKWDHEINPESFSTGGQAA